MLIPLPKADEVCYVGPEPKGQRKNCKNCMMWVKTNQCGIHEPRVEVLPDMVCSYWVGGDSMPEYPKGHKVYYIDPEFSGLMTAKGGTSCDVCKFYKPTSDDVSKCLAVTDETGKKLATVNGKGCCARWTKKP